MKVSGQDQHESDNPGCAAPTTAAGSSSGGGGESVTIEVLHGKSSKLPSWHPVSRPCKSLNRIQ